MTHEEWGKVWQLEFNRLRASFPSARTEVLWRATNKWMHDKYGPRPAAPPSENPRLPLGVRIVASLAGKDMGNILKLLSRFGPLVAAFLVGLVGVIPGADSILQGIVSALGMIGITPDAETAAQFGNLVAAVLLLYGSVIKFYHLIRDKFFPKP